MRALKNEKGLTLIEVLAALVILSIVLVGIMTVFPQMTLFNAKTEAKLNTMNLAREEMERIVSTGNPLKWEGKRGESFPGGYEKFLDKIPRVMNNLPVKVGATPYTLDTSNTNSNFVRYQKTDKYKYVADIYLSCEPLISEPAGGLPCNDPSLKQLYKVHLKIFNGSHLSSETYSYIKFYVKK